MSVCVFWGVCVCFMTFFPVTCIGVIYYMWGLRWAGLVRNVGVSNFDEAQLRKMHGLLCPGVHNAELKSLKR